MTQDEQGQSLEVPIEDMQSITGQSNDTDTNIGDASVGDTEKSRSESRQCTVYRKETVLLN